LAPPLIEGRRFAPPPMGGNCLGAGALITLFLTESSLSSEDSFSSELS
jgi:hypothetical protein